MTITQGVVTFLDGKASVGTGTDWKPLTIGDDVPMTSSVKTDAASTCDIQFGRTGVARIGPNTVIQLKTVWLASGKSAVDLGLTAGTIACKVSKLAGEDRFQVLTSAAVCGVRGTRFVVIEETGMPMKVAVQEGKVAVMPPSFDAAKLDAIATPATASMVDAAINSIMQAAPLVVANQELSVNTSDLAKEDSIVTSVQAQIESTIATAPTQSSPTSGTNGQQPVAPPQSGAAAAALPEQIANALKDYAAAAPQSVQKTIAISDESKKLLEGAANLEIKEGIPAPEQESPSSNSSAAPASNSQSAVTTPTAIQASLKVSESSLVSGLVAGDGRVFAADSNGTVFAFAANGTTLWSAKTENTENENSRPVVGQGEVAFAGDKELCVLDSSNGKTRFSIPLDGASSGLFGRRPAIGAGKLFLATTNGIKVFDAVSGVEAGIVAVPDIEMTPLASGATLYAVSADGTFYVIDGDRQATTGQIKTSASQPIATAPIVSGGSAYFVNRKGMAVRIDLATMAVVWEKRVDVAKSLDVFQDPILGETGLYVFAKSTLYALSSKDGSSLFTPIRGVSSPPAIKDGALWFGTQDGHIVAVDPASGTIRATLKVSAKVVGAPVETGDLLVFPTESGEAIFVNTAIALK
ncbi:MAG: PQQ-binding-like beta-propeller repeat protein [Rectinemataceae bacterium]